MKISHNDYSHSNFFESKNQTFSRSRTKKRQGDEFKQILSRVSADHSEDLEEFRILLPKHGPFWDNGYEDLDR